MNEQSTILIVDDDCAGREALHGVLVSQGYQLLEALDGQSALDLAQLHMPDLILLDVMMPGMDGYEVCQRLRRDPLLREIPVLMLTALDDRASRLSGIDAGADDFISKPYDRTELRARVRTITRLNRYRHLLLERARFVWVVENDQDGYLILDEQGKINFANTAARIVLNLPVGEADLPDIDFYSHIGAQFICIPPDRWNTWPDIENQEEPLYVIRPQDNNQRQLWFEVHMLDLPWLSKKQRLLRITDVTQTFSLGLETWSFQAAARHKLVTPVSNIILSIAVMKMLAKKTPFSKDMQGCFETIEDGTKRLEQEIKDVLEYIHAPMLGAGEMFQVSHLEALIRETSQDLGFAAIPCQITPAALQEKALPLPRRAFQMILWELFENSRKFHPQLDPCIEVLIESQKPGEISIKIADNGTGIPLEHIQHVFKPYYQGEKTYTGEIKGMGLGLSTVALIIWQAGGEICLQNRKDCPGLTVEISFPL